MRITSHFSWNSETKEFDVFYNEVSYCKLQIPDFRTANAIGLAVESIAKAAFNEGELSMRGKILGILGEMR